MKRDPARHLVSVPAGIRARMLADGAKLAPGAAAVTGRFFQIIAERGEPLAAPSRSCFDLAARSEATLATLIRTLAAHAPEICLAGGREARKEWYARRNKAGPKRRRGLAPLPASAPASWPAEWAEFYPALLSAPLRETSKRRFISSVSRSAKALRRAGCKPDWTRWMAYCLLEVFEEDGLRPRTITSYLDGLIALGTHGGIADATLDGIRDIRNLASGRAAALDKLKVARIAELTERGGIEKIGEVIGALRDKAACLPASSAAAERMRRQAAILAVELQVYARTGDVSGWRFGEELIRNPCGTWRLAWVQGKTGGMRSPGELWPEIGEIVDELILAGRPVRYAGLQY